MAKHLTELGEDIALLHYVPEGYQGDEEFDRKCDWTIVRFSTKVGTGGWYRNPWARRELVTTVVGHARRASADYLIYNGWGGSPLFDLSLAAAAKILRIPAFLFVHSSHGFPEVRSKAHEFSTKALLRSAAGVITVCHWAIGFLDGFKVKPERIHVIHNGVDLAETDRYLRQRNPDAFARLDEALPRDRPTILAMSRLHSNKRIDRLVQVMPQILAAVPGARLAIAGVGEEEAHLRRLISKSSAEDSINLLGLVAGDEKFECLARSSVFALPSDYEAFPLAILEAAAFGMPVVATPVGGVPEAIDHLETGLLVQPDDDRALAEALIRLLSNPEEAQRMGENGRRRVEKEFTWTHSAERLLTLVEQSRGDS